MSNISTATANAVMDAVLGGVPLVVGTTLSLKLYTVAPTDAGGGTECPTTKWTNYVAKTLPNNVATWPLASGSSDVKHNAVIIDYGDAVVVNGPETIVAWALYDGTVMRVWNTFVAPIAIVNGSQVVIPIGNISWSRQATVAASATQNYIRFYCADDGNTYELKVAWNAIDGKYLALSDPVV